VDLALRGDEKAFELLVKNHKNRVATTAMNMLADPEEANEIGQQVFIQLYRSLKKFRKEANLSTYITRITINLCLNHLKRRQNFSSRSLELNQANKIRSSENQADFESKELITKALQKLDEKHRSIIVLRMVQGFDTLETASILNLPKGTVLSRLKRGMEKLKIILETEFNYKHYE
jgi:RNA polymerase sigma-70 factor (ECF subfamily)